MNYLILLAANDGAMVLFVLAIFAGAWFFVYAVNTGINNVRNSNLREFARNYRGEVQAAAWHSLPSMTFRHDGLLVTLSYVRGGGSRSKYRTHLTIAWPTNSLRCEIFPASVLSGLRRLIGMHDIEIGVPSFDEPFIITGNDPDAIKKLLTPEAQQALLELAQVHGPSFFGRYEFHLSISRGGLTITKLGYISERHVLDRFVRLFLQFFDASQPAISGIEFLNSTPNSATSMEDEPHCIVCGEALASDIVSCRSCRTPHHLDCWQYFGGCGTYGCGEKRFAQQGMRARS